MSVVTSRKKKLDNFLLIELVKRWKVIVTLTFIGCILSLALTMSLEKRYLASAIVTPADQLTLQLFKSGSVREVTSEELFLRVFEQLRSNSNFKLFLQTNMTRIGGFADISQELLSNEMGLNNYVENFNVSVLDYFDSERLQPYRIQVGLEDKNEEFAVAMVNGYLGFINEFFLNSYIDEEAAIKKEKIKQIEKEIHTEIANEKFKRELLIEKLSHENEAKAAELKGERLLILELAKRERLIKIAEASEALKISTKLNIERPTFLEEFSADERKSTSNINLSNVQELPLYQMGTRYLNTLIETLSARESDLSFDKRIAEIDVQINKIESDSSLKALINRKSDEPYAESVPDLMITLESLKEKNWLSIKLYPLS